VGDWKRIHHHLIGWNIPEMVHSAERSSGMLLLSGGLACWEVAPVDQEINGDLFVVLQLVKRCEEEVNQLDRVQSLFPNDALYLHDKDALSLVRSSFLIHC